MGASELHSEYQDFALETYRHASRYGDSPCDFAFLPRRGIFFWPMEKSELDQRRFRLWARMLKRMEKDKILVPVEESSTKNDFRDVRYYFHPSQYREPYYKNYKIHWPHVNEWYFEYMNGKEETCLLKEAMDHLEKYLDSRDDKEDVKAFDPIPQSKDKAKTIYLPLIKRRDEIQLHLDPSYPLHYRYPNNMQKFESQENHQILEPPRISIPPLSGLGDHTVLLDSFVSPTSPRLFIPSPTFQSHENMTPTELSGRSGSLISCSGCSRCNYKTQFPDDLFEGKILQCEGKKPAKMGCEYIICQDCMKVYNILESNNIEEHLKSPEHTTNVLIRLQETGRTPIETSDTKHRLVILDTHAKLHGYQNVKDYITKGPLMLQENSKLSTISVDEPSCINKTNLSALPAPKPTKNFDEYEVKNPEDLPSESQLYSFKSSAAEDMDIKPDNVNLYESITKDLCQFSNLDDKLNLLFTQQCKASKTLGMLEDNISRAQDSLKDITRQVQASSSHTHNLTQSFLQHDTAIKFLNQCVAQKNLTSNISEGSIDGMVENTKRESFTNRLDHQEKEIMCLRMELKKKVDDVNYYLKVIDRHSNDINSLKQKAWINGQMNNSGESYQSLAQKLEYQLHIQDQVTKNLLLQMDHRFEAINRQHAEDINFLKQMDENKQAQILHLKAQFGLKFAHMEQKQASMRKIKRYV